MLFWLLWLAGEIFRDATWATGMLFYIPSPIVSVLMAAICVWAVLRKKFGAALGFFALAGAPACFVLFVENSFATAATKRQTGKPPARLVHWNIMAGRLGWESITRELLESRADIYVLSEFPKKINARSFSKTFGKDCQSVFFKDMAIFWQGKFRDTKILERDNGLRILSLDFALADGPPLRLFAVDLASTIGKPRNPNLRKLAGHMARDLPDLVVGDFNSPRRSGALAPLPEGFAHAYEAAGSGWSYTWPVFCPVYAIDQCIFGKRIIPVQYDLFASTKSDHRRQMFEFRMDPCMKSGKNDLRKSGDKTT